ncbi:hypothetical protein EVAR_70976_1 [Eumeta japonica]|uniref:Uncharacterized protein n=1 Tax=Eumeta variegata TaxID=151549 RepID=A0A4C2A8U9_EUMVA|nr:hypothetical protein EVAR_70976_1 [Eumeta japonica]
MNPFIFNSRSSPQNSDPDHGLIIGVSSDFIVRSDSGLAIPIVVFSNFGPSLVMNVKPPAPSFGEYRIGDKASIASPKLFSSSVQY